MPKCIKNICKSQWNPFLNYKRVTYTVRSDVRLRKALCGMNFRRFLERSLDERDRNDRSVNIFQNCVVVHSIHQNHKGIWIQFLPL